MNHFICWSFVRFYLTEKSIKILENICSKYQMNPQPQFPLDQVLNIGLIQTNWPLQLPNNKMRRRKMSPHAILWLHAKPQAVTKWIVKIHFYVLFWIFLKWIWRVWQQDIYDSGDKSDAPSIGTNNLTVPIIWFKLQNMINTSPVKLWFFKLYSMKTKILNFLIFDQLFLIYIIFNMLKNEPSTASSSFVKLLLNFYIKLTANKSVEPWSRIHTGLILIMLSL